MNIQQRNKILLAHMDLIKQVARSYYASILSNTCPMYETEDLENELIPVMMRSISRHNPSQLDLRSFSRRRMYGHILDLIRTHHQVRIPRSVWKKCKEGHPLDQFYRLFSINKPIRANNFPSDEGYLDTFESTLFSNNISQEEQLLIKEFASTCLSAFNLLKSERTKAIILSHVFHGHTFASLTKLFKITETRLCQITSKAKQVMLVHVKKAYPNISRVEGVIETYGVPKQDKQLSTSLDKIETFELIRFVVFLTKGEK